MDGSLNDIYANIIDNSLMIINLSNAKTNWITEWNNINWKRESGTWNWRIQNVYWKENQHPFVDIFENHLVNFNEYYVENFHSRLCATININQNAESIINQAFVIGKFKYIYTNIKKMNLLIV